MSIGYYILESSFSYGTGYSQIYGMRKVLHVITNLLHHYLLASLYNV